LIEFADDSLEFAHDSPIRASLFINLDEFDEIPKLLLATTLESAPDCRSDFPVVLKNCAGVV
jgi:hypothetical protein